MFGRCGNWARQGSAPPKAHRQRTEPSLLWAPGRPWVACGAEVATSEVAFGLIAPGAMIQGSGVLNSQVRVWSPARRCTGWQAGLLMGRLGLGRAGV